MSRRPAPTGVVRSRSAEGSTLLVALLVLLVLTAVSMTLAAATQTELMIGSNERRIQHLLYSVEAGRAAAVARYRASGDESAFAFRMASPGRRFRSGGRNSELVVVEVGPMQVIQEGPCAPEALGQASSGSTSGCAQVTLAITVHAVVVNRTDGTPLATRSDNALVDVLRVAEAGNA